jgi:hypothetical protein
MPETQGVAICQNESLEPVYFQVMLGKGRPDTMGYADEELYQRRDAHLRG